MITGGNMQKQLVSSLIKAKTTNKKDVETLIDEFLNTAAKESKKQSEAFLSELFIYLMQNLSMPKKQLLEIVKARLQQLSIVIPTNNIEAIYTKTAIATSGVGFVFDKLDSDAIKMMHNNFFWLKDNASENMRSAVKEAVEEAFRGKIEPDKIGEYLRDKFGMIGDESSRYFQGVSDHIIRQSQSIARLRQYQKAGVKTVQIIATIDSKTSQICRSMHGRVIPIEHLITQAQAIQSAKTIEEKKAAAIWPKGTNFAKLPKNLGLPPFHFRCRTRIGAYYGGDIVVDGKVARGSQKPGSKYKESKVAFSHIDKTSREIVVTDADYAHFNASKHPISKKDIISALNSISEIAPHAKNSLRFSAWSHNGYYLSFEGNTLITIFKPDDKYSYFKRNAKINKKEILKWKLWK